MTLFADGASHDIERAARLVEQAIEALGVDPEQSRLESRDGVQRFSLRRGSASMMVTVHPPRGEHDAGRLRVVAPVIELPETNRQPALFRRLLEANAREVSGSAFALLDERVVLVSERSIEDLDASEVDTIIRVVGKGADHFDDALAREFNVSRCTS